MGGEKGSSITEDELMRTRLSFTAAFFKPDAAMKSCCGALQIFMGWFFLVVLFQQ